MSGFQKLSDLAPITMTALAHPQRDDETWDEWVKRIQKILKRQKGNCKVTIAQD